MNCILSYGVFIYSNNRVNGEINLYKYFERRIKRLIRYITIIFSTKGTDETNRYSSNSTRLSIFMQDNNAISLSLSMYIRVNIYIFFCLLDNNYINKSRKIEKFEKKP